MKKNSSLHETCPQYVARRLSEGWRIISQDGFDVILQSPEGIIRPVDLRNDVETLRPNATGDETSINSQEPYYGGSHYDRIDEEVADDATTYVENSAVNAYQRDLYNLPAHTGSGTINYIKIYFRCRGAATGTQYAKPSLKSNSTITDGTEVGDVPSTYTTYSQQWDTNPADGQPWEWADIDALQIGVSLNAGGTVVDFYVCRCTQVYVEVDYTAIVAPTVTTQTASSVEATTATGNGTITATGGENCTRRGFCYKVGTSGDPTTADSVAYDDNGFGTGPYTKAITGLTQGTGYRVRAYAVNSAGTGYGTTVQILTKPAAPTGVAASDGAYIDKVVITWTKSTGATGYQVYRDGAALGWLGDVATYDDTGAGAPTITPGSAIATDGSSTAQVDLSLSGTSVSNGTTHTYVVRARNAAGESADSSSNTGYRGHGSLTYQWQRSAGDSDASYSNISGATSASYSDTAAPAPTITPGSAAASDGAYLAHVALSLSGQSANVGAGRYYKCLVSATGATSQYSTADRGYRGVGTLTYQWQRSAADSNANYSDISGATTASYSDTGAPADGSGRYYRCVENATGAAEQTSTSNRGYRATYYSSGYIGDVIDCTALVDTYSRLEWTEELDSQDIQIKIRSSPDNATWSTWESIYSSPCTSFTTPVKRYLEWRATLLSDTMATPKLKDLTFNWTKKVE